MTYFHIVTTLFVASFAVACWLFWEVARWHDRALASETEVWELRAELGRLRLLPLVDPMPVSVAMSSRLNRCRRLRLLSLRSHRFPRGYRHE